MQLSINFDVLFNELLDRTAILIINASITRRKHPNTVKFWQFVSREVMVCSIWIELQNCGTSPSGTFDYFLDHELYDTHIVMQSIAKFVLNKD